MFYRFFYRLQIASLAVLVVAFGTDLANSFWASEEVVPIEIAAKIVTAEMNAVALETSRTQRPANPFVPTVAPPQKIVEMKLPAGVEAVAAARLDARNILLTAFANPTEMITGDQLNHCKANIERTLAALPTELTASLDTLKLYFSRRTPRGLSNSHIVELRCAKLSDAEITSVFVHELGHVADLGYLRGESAELSGFHDGSYSIPLDDPSAEFYQISWSDEKNQKFVAERMDFVSGYAMSDSFEDFAESFNFYILHGADFRALATESSALQKKYDFLRTEVFGGTEFQSERTTRAGKRVWDVTLLDFDRAEFFARG